MNKYNVIILDVYCQETGQTISSLRTIQADNGRYHIVDEVDARIAELEAEVPAVGSFAWALMQANSGKVVVSPEGVSFKKTTSDYWNPESKRYDITRDNLCDLTSSEDYWDGNLFDSGWKVTP